MMEAEETLVEIARRHVLEGETHLRRQVEIVAELRRDGHPTEIAEALLGEFEQTLKDHKTHLSRLEAEQRAGVRDRNGELVPGRTAGLNR
jgi:hypothetical protein